MQLDELLALLGPDGISALGEDVSIRQASEPAVTVKGVVSLSADHAEAATSAKPRPAGAVILAGPEPARGDILVVRGERYKAVRIENYSDGYFKCTFETCTE